MAAEPIDDIVELGGQNFATKGAVQGNAVSEFEAGVKIGPPNQDNREHAFFVVLNDFSGGFGSRQVDIREELGTFWYPEANSPETAFAGRITLPIKQELITIASGPSRCLPSQVGQPWCRTSDGYYVFGLGNCTYRLNEVSIGGQPTNRVVSAYGTSAKSLVSLAHVITPLQADEAHPTGDTDERIYASWDANFNPGSGFGFSLSFDNGASFTVPTMKWYTGTPEDATSVLSVNWVYKKITPTGPVLAAIGPRQGGNGGTGVISGGGSDVSWEILIPTFNGGYRPLDFFTGEAASPTNFVEGDPHPKFIGQSFESAGAGQRNITDLFYWDKKLLGVFEGQFHFLVPRANFNHLEEIEWSFDDDGYITEQRGIKEPSHISGTTAAVPGVAGEEPWNTFLVGVDGEAVGVIEDGEKAFFLGTGEGPTGEALPYVRAGRKLHILDFYARATIPIEIGAAGPLVSGGLINGEIVATDAWNVFAYKQGTVRNVGLPKKPGFGIPPNLLAATGGGTKEIQHIFNSDHYIMAVVVDKSDSDHPSTTLLRYSGIGWHQVGETIEDFLGSYGFQMHFGTAGTENLQRYIFIPGTTGGIPTAATEDPPAAYALFTLPNLTHQSTVGRDTFGESGASMVTGWYDGGFLDIEGTLLRLNVDAWSLTATETIKIEYRLDNDEDDDAWVQMVDVNGDAAVFDNTHRVLYFDADPDDPRQGVEFRTVQFRITLNRGADATRSPELRALTMVYLKTPPLRTSWTFAIDVNRMVERSAGDDTTFYVDGSAATLENIWAKLRELWDTHKLLTFSIPNVQEDFFVKITDMPLTFDDFRNAVAGQGQITIQVLEPVET